MELVSETLMSFYSKSTILVRLSALIKSSERKTQDVTSKGIVLRLFRDSAFKRQLCGVKAMATEQPVKWGILYRKMIGK